LLNNSLTLTSNHWIKKNKNFPCSNLGTSPKKTMPHKNKINLLSQKPLMMARLDGALAFETISY
jgi:hypothetical protein